MRPLRPHCLPRALATAVLVLAAAAAAPARAQPVTFELKNDVAAGQKPTLTLLAAERVLDVRLDLERTGGQRFTQQAPALRPLQRTTLPIGDGAPGRHRWKGTLTVTLPGGQGAWSQDLEFETLVRAPVEVRWDFEHLDLAGRVLAFQLSRPAGSAELTVIGEDGEELGRGTATYRGEPPGTWLAVPWTAERPGVGVLKMRLRAVSAEGLPATVDLVPWQLRIDHEDVTFATDSAAIEPGEAAKLESSLGRIRDGVRRVARFVRVQLYVAGHTDTVGSLDHNRRLSHDRARAIATWFRAHGLGIPIVYDGFGEEALKVPTADETPEAANRRADYVLGPAGGPVPGALPRRGTWRPVK